MLRDVQDRASRRWGTKPPEAGGKSVMETGGWVDQPCPSDIPNCVMVCLETCVWDRSSTVGGIMDASGWPEPCKAWWNQAISNKVRKRRISAGLTLMVLNKTIALKETGYLNVEHFHNFIHKLKH